MTAPSRYAGDLKTLLTEAADAYRRRDDQKAADLLEQAVARAPYRTDVILDLASCHLHMEAPEEALNCYRRALEISPGDPEALTLAAHWLRFLGNAAEAEAMRAVLNQANPDKARALRRLWDAMDEDARRPVDAGIPETFAAAGGKCAVVALGYVLNQDGSMHERLLERLEKTLEALKARPDAAVVVSGGVPRSGKVEAEEMRRWLVGKGVPAGQIHEEGYSRDILENILYSRDLLESLRVRHALFVTSAINVRRTRLIADLLRRACGAEWSVDAVAAKIAGDRYSADCGPGDFKIHRDVVRAHGIPLMRTYPELVSR